VTCARLRIDNESIEWGESLSYLGIVIKSAKNFKCCFHEKKIKFYRSINGILGKLGSDPPISVTLSLVSSNCVPVLLYGLEALMLNKADINTLSYPYNSVFMKLFKSFNKNIIMLCQYYCGELPLEYLLHSRNLNFYSKLNMAESSPASVLYKWFGKREWDKIATDTKYNIMPTDFASGIAKKIWTVFTEVAKNLEKMNL
jgi:hypothetical protein